MVGISSVSEGVRGSYICKPICRAILKNVINMQNVHFL